jgi:Fe(3+) dicitrate transport protein
VLVLEDGVPAAINPYSEPDLYYGPPVERLRGVEVVKGSGSILFGPQTIGGVVNFLTHAPPDARRLHVQMDGGYPGQFELLGRYGDRYGDVRYVAQVFGKRGDGPRGEDYYATDGFAKIAVPVSAQSEITAKIGFHDEGVNTTDLGLTQAMFEQTPRRPTLSPFDWAHLTHLSGSVMHRAWLGEGIELDTLAYLTSTNRLWRRQDYDRVPLPGVTYDRIVGDVTRPQGAIYFRTTNSIRDRSYTVFGVEPKLHYRFETSGISHTLDVGARFLSESAHRAQRAGDSPLSEAGALQSQEDNGTIALAGYVQDRIAFKDWLLVTPGLRFEYASETRNIRREIVAGVPKDVSITGNTAVYAPIPGIGIVVGTPRIHGFGGLHFGFAPPRIATAITDTGVDQQLDAERAIHYEAGVRASPLRFLRGEATLFLSNFQNQIIPGVLPGTTVSSLVNGGQTRHVGAEVAARLEFGRALRLPLAIDLTGSFTALSATFVGGPNDGHALPYAPSTTVSAVLDVEHPLGFGALASWTLVGSQFSDEANTRTTEASGRTGEIPAYQILDFTFRYTHKPTGLGAALAIKNALDEIYVVSRRPDGIFPAGFRQIIGSVRWTYDEGAQ